MLQVGLAGTFAMSLEAVIRRHLTTPCKIIVADEIGIVSGLGNIDVLVSLALTREMGDAGSRLKLVQVPGAGLDRIDRSALPAGALLANVFGHETGIAE
jgi:phosphoglycerate dehydrogenase-like enzyme